MAKCECASRTSTRRMRSRGSYTPYYKKHPRSRDAKKTPEKKTTERKDDMAHKLEEESAVVSNVGELIEDNDFFIEGA